MLQEADVGVGISGVEGMQVLGYIIVDGWKTSYLAIFLIASELL